MLRLLVLFPLWTGFMAPAETRFTDRLWSENRDIYQQILRHPFLKGLVDGTLKRESFAFYMAQDAHYLREFARALSQTAARAPKEEWAALLSTHAADTFRQEKKLHESVFKEYGISEQQVAHTEPSPEAFGYSAYLVATAYARPFAESMAALLPCYWIYWEVGKELRKQGSTDPVYRKWIEAYASEDYGDAVTAVLRIVDELARDARPGELNEMRRHFRRAARYEWMFWDSAYHRRGWPPSK